MQSITSHAHLYTQDYHKTPHLFLKWTITLQFVKAYKIKQNPSQNTYYIKLQHE